MPKPSHRDSIVTAGLKVMFRSGYNGSSVRDIVAEAGVPQGSFTNHFRSKEGFAEAVLNHYFGYVQGLVREALEDRSLSPRQRLRRYLDVITTRLEADHWSRGCLIGDLSLEASGQSEALRTRLGAIYEEWRAPFAGCIAEAQAGGEIAAAFDATDLAEFLLASWQGAILRMKVERGPAPLERFKRIAFETVFKETETHAMPQVTIVYCRPCGYEKRAREAAAAVESACGVVPELVPGTGGVFDVKVGDRTVARRAKGHFPSSEEIVAAVRTAIQSGSAVKS
jgi:TetR/AcrR family transcriptional repressor of nem operon